MAKQQNKRPRKKTSASHHQTNWLWGEHLVLDTLTAGRWRVYELFVSTQLLEKYSEHIQAKQKEGVEVEVVLHARLNELAGTTEHQGIAARVSKYPYVPVDEFIKTLQIPIVPISPVVIMLDRIQDTFAFGSVLRCCQANGVAGVVVGDFCQAQVTPQIARFSMGAVNHFPIVKAVDLVSTAQTMQQLGYQIVALDQQSEQDISTIARKTPTMLVIGSDVQPIDPNLITQCNQRLRIPCHDPSIAMNSAIVTGVMLYEFNRS
jgi:23S rRNA (guanosine2251-2'-O)-methyltransferase